MRILYMDNGFVHYAVSGGSMRVARVGQKLQKWGVDIYVLTTVIGHKRFKELGLDAKYFALTSFPVLEKFKHTSIVYVLICLFGIVKALSFKVRRKFELIHTSSDFIYDTIPAWLCKKRDIGNKWVAMVHHKIDSPWKRRGNFLVNLLAYISQQVSFRLIRNGADLIFVLKTPEGKQVRNHLLNLGIPSERIAFVINGIDSGFIKHVSLENKLCDACCSSGLQPSRGGFDVIYIWRQVCANKKNVRLIIIARGFPKTGATLKNIIDKEGLSDNIQVLEYLPRESYLKLIKSSKIFINPKYEEGWGIAVYEAMASGLPVVTYNLPAFERLNEGIVKVPIGDRMAFASAIIELLTNENLRRKMSEEAKKIASEFNWDKVAKQDLTQYKDLQNRKI